MRAFMWLTRPFLVALNGMSNGLLRRCGVEPVDELAGGRTAADLRELVDHSATAGALDRARRDQLVAALELDLAPVGDLARADVAGVDAADPVARVREVARESGHLRLVVREAGRTVGVVHVRDTLAVPPGRTAGELMRPLLVLPADRPGHAALGTMRERRTHLALVERDGALLGVVTMHDLLARLLPARSDGRAPRH